MVKGGVPGVREECTDVLALRPLLQFTQHEVHMTTAAARESRSQRHFPFTVALQRRAQNSGYVRPEIRSLTERLVDGGALHSLINDIRAETGLLSHTRTEKDHVMGVVKVWGRQLRTQCKQREEKRERETLVEAADMLARLEQRSRMNLGRHDEMERRRKELADLKEGMTTLVEPRRARHRASTGASRWDDTYLPIPPAAITAFRDQMQQQADM